MGKRSFARLIGTPSQTFDSLKDGLRRLGVETYSGETCREAEALIIQCEPALVFADHSLEGSWAKLLTYADQAEVPPKVIVVGGFPDMKRYASVKEMGAFDFIAPPFEPASLEPVVQSAQGDIRRRRETLAAAVA